MGTRANFVITMLLVVITMVRKAACQGVVPTGRPGIIMVLPKSVGSRD